MINFKELMNTSTYDFRGITLNRTSDLLGMTEFELEKVTNESTLPGNPDVEKIEAFVESETEIIQ